MSSEIKKLSKKYLMKNNYTLLFSILSLIALIFTILSFVQLHTSWSFIENSIYLFPAGIWLLFFISIVISGIFAYYEKYKLMVLPILIVLLIFTIQVRTSNVSSLIDVSTGESTLGPDLDPFLYLRNVYEILSGTNTGKIDAMRYVPVGAPSFIKVNLMPWTIVFFYKIALVFSSASPTDAAIFTPVILFAISLIGFFLFTQLIFSFKLNKGKSSLIAIIASFFYAFAPSMLHRTTGGIPEIESLGMAFIWFAFFFFAKAWKSNSNKKLILFGVLSGIFTGLMSLSWGGYRYIYMIFGLASLIIFVFDKNPKKNFIVFTSWLIPALILEFIKVKSIIGIITNYSVTGFALGVFGLIVLNKIIGKLKIKKLEKIKLPNNFKTILIGAILLILVFLIVNPKGLINLISGIIEGLLFPFGRGRVGLTVAENKAPYLVDAISQFSSIIWIFFLGTLVLFIESVKHFNKKDKIKLISGFIIFLAGISFSRISSTSMLNGDNFISTLFFLGGIILFLLLFFSIVRKNYLKDKKNFMQDFKRIDFSYILLLAFSFWAIISMRGAIRLFFIVSPMIILIASYVPVKIFGYRKIMKDDLVKIGSLILVAILIILMVISFVQYAQATKYEASATAPGLYEQQWQNAMKQVREKTSEDAVFVHWWDYGYWVQTLGERATVTDGGHYIGYWDHLVGRYVLTTPYPETAYSFMKTHKVDYLLIDSTDLGKYTAYSSIGSDSEFDRFSGIPLMAMDSSQTKETTTSTILIYQGAWGVDEDIRYMSEGEEIFIPGPIYDEFGSPSYLGYVIGTMVERNSQTQEILQPKAYFIYQQKQIIIPIRYLYYEGKLIDYGGGLDSVFMLIPKAYQSDAGLQYEKTGSGIYLSPKVSKSLFAQTYLLNNAFENYNGLNLVYSEKNPIISSLENYEVQNIGDFIDFQGFRGPIKIWEVNYPESTVEIEGFLNFTGDYAEFDDLIFVK